MVEIDYRIEVIKESTTGDTYILVTAGLKYDRYYLSKYGKYKTLNDNKQTDYSDLIKVSPAVLQSLANALCGFGYIKASGATLAAKDEHINDLRSMSDRL